MPRSTPSLIPPAARAEAARLIDQQMWCWGCDVRRAGGNLLLAYGMMRHPSPDPRFHSAYIALCEDCALTLWGWGIWVASAEGALFIDRARFRAGWRAEGPRIPEAWSPVDLPPTAPPADSAQADHARDLLARALAWISDYERWVLATLGDSYRAEALAAWPGRRRGNNGESALPGAWDALRAALSVTSAARAAASV